MEQNQTAQTNEVIEIAENDEKKEDNLESVKTEKVIQSQEQNKEFASKRRNQEKEIFEKEIVEKTKLSVAKELIKKFDKQKEIDSYEDFEKFLITKLENKNAFENLKGKEVFEENMSKNIDSNNEDKIFKENDENNNQNIIKDYQKDLNKNKINSNIDEEEWFFYDKKNFLSQNPEFDEEKFNSLILDEDFGKFASGKVGRVPLGEIYNEYNFFLKKLENLATEKAQKMFLKKISSPGSLTANPYYSKTLMWSDMNETEFEKAISNAKKGFYSNKK